MPDTAAQSRATLRIAARRLTAQRIAALASLLVAVAIGAACERTIDAPDANRTPTPLDASMTGAITGHVRFHGTKPPPRHVQVTSDATCVAAHPDGLDVEDVRGDDHDVLADAFVWIARGLEARVFAVPETHVVVDQRDCVFAPRVVGARARQQIDFVNSDDTLHNVHGTPAHSPAWNFGLGIRGARRTITIAHPEVPVGVQCDVHPWMHAALGVVDHPYFAVTALDGVFTLAGVPAGQYTLAAWHPRLGKRQQEIEVAAGATTELDLTFAP